MSLNESAIKFGEYCKSVGLYLKTSLTFGLDVLPNGYTTPLYFTPKELLQLKGSPAQSESHLRLVLKQVFH